MKLTINNLTKTYGNKVKALDNINLKIGKGMFGLLGPNGAGKSTLMRTIATLQSPDSGEIALNGAAAHKGAPGDLLVILSFVQLDADEAADWEPRIIIVGDANKSFQKKEKSKLKK
mgnify:CR=1 FL=1